MEAAVARTSVVLLGIILITWAWRVLNWVWLKPRELERCLRQQGLTGKPYRLFFGDTKESTMMLKQTHSKPLKLSNSHDIAPRILPFQNQIVNSYGKNSFVWMGTIPRVNIMNPEDLRDAFNKYDSFRRSVENQITKLFLRGPKNIDDEKWVKHRKIINPAFHLEKIKGMLPIFHQCCRELIDTWESLVSKEGSYELDVCSSLERLSSDMISRAAFGSSFEEGRKIFELLKEQTQVYAISVSSVYIPGWSLLPTKINKRMKGVDKEIRELLKGIINTRQEAIKAGEVPKDDLLGTLLECNSKENEDHGWNNKNIGINIDDVIEECKLFYFAGQETTSLSLVWTMILLSQNQNWQDRAREEVLQVVGSNMTPTFDALNHLQVVTMVILESLRLYPPGTEPFRITDKTTQLGKLSLPAGVEVALPILLVHHDKELWGDDADEFKPERFSEGVLKATNNQFTYFPFGAGPRICIGQSFAMLELKMALSLILLHFTFELSPSYVHAPSVVISLRPQYGAHIILRKRC